MVVLFLAGGVSFAGPLTFYTNEQDFQADAVAGGDALTVEDFTCSTAEPGGACNGIGPVNSSTNDACFMECLSDGWEFSTGPTGEYVVYGTGIGGLELPAVGACSGAEGGVFRWNFNPPVPAVGFRVFGDVEIPLEADCAFKPPGVVKHVVGTLPGTFIGAISQPPGLPISQVECVVQFGPPIPPAPLLGKLQFAALGGIDADGVIDLAEATFCSSSYFLTDPCTGEVTWIRGDYSLLVDLGQFLCEYASVSGPDIGVECVVVGIESFELGTPPCLVQVPGLRLSFDSGGNLKLQWKALACVDGYDVIRGSLSELSAGDLGSVSCVAENVTAPQKSLAGDPDPLPGEGFIYLVRAVGGEWGFAHYGHTHDGVQRFPESGDCVP
jgi:hypothetical protein